MSQETLVRTDALTVNNYAKVGVLSEGQMVGTVVTLATNGTIPLPASVGIVRVTAAGAITGVAILPGIVPGQRLTVIHEGPAANTITMAVSSNVSDGTSDVIAGLTCRSYVWDSITALWYPSV